MFSLILLSAGLSSRFGSPKALALWDQKPLIMSTLETLLKTDLDEIIVVLGAHEELIQPFLLKHNRIKVVYNKDYKFGQTSSFKAGLAAVASDAVAVGLLPVDYPFINPPTVNHLIAESRKKEPLILIPTCQNKKGHPPFFSMILKNEILELSNDTGLNIISQKHEQDIVVCPVDDKGIILSFNTPEELQVLLLGSSGKTI